VLLLAAGRGTALWLSRHEPLEAELEELGRRYGVGALVIVRRRLSSFREALALVARYRPKAVVAVIPAAWVLELARRGVPVLLPVFADVRASAERPERADGKDCAVARVGSTWVVKRFVGFAPIHEAVGRGKKKVKAAAAPSASRALARSATPPRPRGRRARRRPPLPPARGGGRPRAQPAR